MRKEFVTYAAVFLVILVSALVLVLPGVESSPLSGQSLISLFGEPREVSEGFNLEEQLNPERFSIQLPQQVQNPNHDIIGENLRKIEELYRFIDKNFIYELDHDEMYTQIINALFGALDDPYSSYIPEDRATRITDTTTGVYGGIGAYISKPDPAHRDESPSSYMVTIVAPFQGSPAHRAGLHAGDLLSHIDGRKTDDLTAEEASRLLRGQEGTEVTVTVYKNENLSYDVTIMREVVAVPTVEYDMIDTIGYMKILQFTPVTPEKVMEAIRFFRENYYTSMIIDMRQNPGGEFSAVRRIADFFLQEGVIVSTESRVPGQSRVYRSTPLIQVPPDIPIAVLVDGGSASGSEILAGALQDNKRATVIGENTFGKGYVQGVFPFDRDFFKITISRYLTPLDQDIEKSGITPDIISKADRLSDEEAKSATELRRSRRLAVFADEHPDIDTAPIDEFVKTLQEDGYNLSSRYILMLLQQEYYSRLDFPPVYDLTYDETLKKAIEVLR